MESFEAIRRIAAKLNAEIVASGASPLQPLALVVSAVHALELELVWLTPGHTALKGARALFDDQSGTIACETAGSDVDRAQLVAHELGHVSLHAMSSACRAEDIDASRSTEAAPVGLQKVEDYGARERRELQANVFAREFLLPRALARRLHVDDGFGVSAISATTGLPENLVRQQLFDVLLLPAAVEDSGEVRVRSARDDRSQDRAATHRGSAFQLQAGPGTGKTRTLERRVRSLIDEGIDPSSMLALTFSNRAAAELSERLIAAFPGSAERIWIGTFHAFGLDLIRRYHDSLGLPADPVLFDRSDAIEVLEEILPTLPLVHFRNLWDPAMVLRDVVTAISRAKDEMTDARRYRELAEAMPRGGGPGDTRTAADKCLEVARIYEVYEQALRDNGAVDFGDLIMRPTLLLESNDSLRAAIRLRHRHVLVDEYQDVNRASARLLAAIAGDGKRLWVVGDTRQSIYRFRGASSSNMELFTRDYPGSKTDQLDLNYRSTKQIVDTLVAIAPRMGASQGMLPLAFTSDRGIGPTKPEIRKFETLEDEAEGVAAGIRELERAGVRLCDQAVLCRGNRRLAEMAEALEQRGIPVLHLGSLFEREEIRDLLSLLSLAVDRFGSGLARVGSMPRYRIPLQDIFRIVQHLRTTEVKALSALPDLGKVEGLSLEGAKGVALLAADLGGLGASSSAWDFLSHYLLDSSRFAAELAGRDSVRDRMQGIALWQFLNFVRERSPIGSGAPIQRTLERVRQLVLLAEERDLRQVPSGALHLDAVRLMTVHGSKGLEFEAVHIPGLTVASFPLSNRGQRCPPPDGMIDRPPGVTTQEEARRSQDDEEECLFFVAVSRARTNLRFYLPRRQSNGNQRKPSPFLDWLPTRLVSEIQSPAKLPLPPDARLPESRVPVTHKAVRAFTDAELSLCQKCPRRFFYTHILGLGGAKKPTAFTRTHDCLYGLIEWLGDARQGKEPTLSEAEAAFEEIWTKRGPDHAAAAEYRRLASRLVSALIKAGAGRRFRTSEPLAVDLPNGRVMVTPNEIAELPNGMIVLRRVRTGAKRSEEYDDLTYSLYQLAGEAHFGRRFRLEALHLTDDVAEDVPITARKLQNRKEKTEEMLASIGTGQFPTDLDAVRCPRCPHFFVCPALPEGPLSIG
jgi:DNA helicase II / ATP-dependent DNA helicase PcrA